MTPPEIFSRSARRLQRARVLSHDDDDRWILRHAAEDMLARLDAVRIPLQRALVIGIDPCGLGQRLRERGLSVWFADPSPALAEHSSGIACDEDRLPFADGQFDLILALGTLDTVSDLPGALILIRRALSEGGLFMASFPGTGSLPSFRACLQDAEEGRVAARFHPLVDVRGAGDLLARAGFALPVAECETLSVRYRSLERLAADLRANGFRNCLAGRTALGRRAYARLCDAFAEPVTEQFALITMTGWAVAPR